MPEDFDGDSTPYRMKKSLDRALPAVILVLGLYLYIEFLASSKFILYPYKAWLQYSLLAYFVTELVVIFSMYEDNRKFFSNHWIDILLTLPFVTAFKGLASLKFLKSSKTLKSIKSGKAVKGTKLVQKLGKFLKKTKKQLKKKL